MKQEVVINNKDVILTDNPLQAVLDIVTDFENNNAITIEKGVYFQIRIDEETYEKLSDDIKNILKKYVSQEERKQDASCGGPRWKEEFYWQPCKAYIFDYNLKDCITVQTNCVYEFEDGLCGERIFVINTKSVPKLIYENINANERKKNFKEGK